MTCLPQQYVLDSFLGIHVGALSLSLFDRLDTFYAGYSFEHITQIVLRYQKQGYLNCVTNNNSNLLGKVHCDMRECDGLCECTDLDIPAGTAILLNFKMP